jgi:hypothetical protein
MRIEKQMLGQSQLVFQSAIHIRLKGGTDEQRDKVDA